MDEQKIINSFRHVKEDIQILRSSLSRVIESQNQLFVLINELTEQQKRKKRE